MRTAIKEDPKLETEIRDETLKVLEAISALMYTLVRSRCPFNTLAETSSSLSNLRQIQDKKLADFIERFNQEKQLVNTQLGKHFLDVFLSNTVEYNVSKDDEEKGEMKSEDFENFVAILFIQASNQSVYGKMQDEYWMDYANKKEDYLKAVVKMVDVMRQVKIIQKKPDKGKWEKDKNKNSDAKTETSFDQ